MANRRLSATEVAEIFRPILEEVRAKLRGTSRGDEALHWALRRKLTKELMYDERGKPLHRVKLKALKRGEQGGKCALCHCELPERNAVLDRLEAMKGYTADNTRLLCPDCDHKAQVERGFA
ncbi:MAG TPA: hypothetical protein VGK76_01890 [Candidatus Eisenbacteria bacterium]|jgi:hypothetical protein